MHSRFSLSLSFCRSFSLLLLLLSFFLLFSSTLLMFVQYGTLTLRWINVQENVESVATAIVLLWLARFLLFLLRLFSLILSCSVLYVPFCILLKFLLDCYHLLSTRKNIIKSNNCSFFLSFFFLQHHCRLQNEKMLK